MRICSFLSIIAITNGHLLMSDQDYKAQTKQSYDDTATAYNDHMAKLETERKAKAFLSYLQPGVKILDIGCGPGRDAKYFTDLGFQVTGIDISEKMIELAQKTAPGATFCVMDSEEMQFPSASFDAVWASASLLHSPKDRFVQILEQMRSFVKEDGIIYLSMKQGDGEVFEEDARYGGVKKFWSYYQEQELLSLLQTCGFQIVEHHVYDKSTAYQTHPWISVICKNAPHRTML